MVKIKAIYSGILLLGLSFSIYAQDLETITPEKFLSQNFSSERKQIVDFMVHQFAELKEHGITQQELDQFWKNSELKNTLYMARFQIINQKLYADSFDIKYDRFLDLILHLQKQINQYHINDVDFIIVQKDEILASEMPEMGLQRPFGFMMSKDLNSEIEKKMLLFPDAIITKSYWGNLIPKIKKGNNEYKWENKENKIFWRGATTGSVIVYNTDNFNKLPRLSLVIESALYPDLIDAKFSYYPQLSQDTSGENLRTILDLLNRKDSERVKEEDHLKYKYLISIDGNNCTWGRPVWIMLSNSVLVKQETNKTQWFYAAIKPYVHYVPVNERLTDLLPQIEWMKSHDVEL